MSDKIDCNFDMLPSEYDFSLENSEFKEKLRLKFLSAAKFGAVLPLADSDLEVLNAAGQPLPARKLYEGKNE